MYLAQMGNPIRVWI
ncbi:hypothetical protein F383_14091 [Gossypium arboreum]|uniref:Uncharacterized protein n=1 Tax=Gossypium arboreum TaxID=29729 RepID=A0A0B0NDT7_GOSAR|nr:hypothetical protein F383_14091 [Gossypium arboreum]